MPLIFYAQCPICGETGQSLSRHYLAVHSEFYLQNHELNKKIIEVSVVLLLVGLGSVLLLLSGTLRLMFLVWGLLLLTWFSYALLVWQPEFDRLSDRFADDWRTAGKTSNIDQIVQGSSTNRRSSTILCPICKQGPFRLGLGIRYHTRIHHSDYFAWYQRWIRQTETMAISVVLVLLVLGSVGFLDPLFASSFAVLIMVVPALVFASIFAANRSSKQNRWRRESISRRPES